ncbi:MAG: hypothetical protein ACFFD1_09865 [Candidatus Thorarchaeota archaeon]
MSLNEKGFMSLVGRIQDGVFHKSKGLLKGKNQGELFINSTKVVFTGVKSNIEFLIPDIKNVELVKRKARIHFKLSNGEVYSFYCLDPTLNGSKFMIEIMKRNEIFYDILDLMINKKVIGESLDKAIEKHKKIQVQQQGRKPQKRQYRHNSLGRGSDWACLCELILLMVITIIVIIFLAPYFIV